jgi:SAM-dependent methyltransferase
MSSGLKPELLERLACPKCGQSVKLVAKDRLVCTVCKTRVPVDKDRPIFTPVPAGMQAAPTLARGPDQGSGWRQANWRFLEAVIAALPANAVIMDFGAGHGDFSQILNNRTAIALDVFPYDEIDIVCDMQKVVPFKKSSFDAIVLMNVLEHVQQPERLVKTLTGLLRPGGSLIVTVPFLLKLHQLPYDFYRYSHEQLMNIGRSAGIETTRLEGYYDPISLVKESILNVRLYALPGMPFIPRKLGRLVLELATWFITILGTLIGKGHVANPDVEKSVYPVGYHVVYQAQRGTKK